MNRRSFLRTLASGLLVAATPAVLVPERRYWQVSRNAPVGRRPQMFDWADRVMADWHAFRVEVEGFPDAIVMDEQATWSVSSSDDVLADLRAFEDEIERDAELRRMGISPDIRYVSHAPPPGDLGVLREYGGPVRVMGARGEFVLEASEAERLIAHLQGAPQPQAPAVAGEGVLWRVKIGNPESGIGLWLV